jgi:hypothetical protein
MARDAATTKFQAARVLLILGVLASLCVSDNVGPRLLPLPLTAGLASAPAPSDWGQAASPTPSHGRTTGARVEMVSATQSRAGAERQSPQAAAQAPKFELAAPLVLPSLRRELYPPSAESSPPFSRPKGRAPPSLV